ncbi:hypothetical protein AAG570_003714 [Ranatra chinensis]|uniref:Kynurenine 3-monooxygenase n=1 Tax=Ranatra chinensis TaxID=642074 RepID=A0ABD0YSY9_9HEMI
MYLDSRLKLPKYFVYDLYDDFSFQVGALSACYFGQRGYHVHLYEYRKDPRVSGNISKGRSINLALSNRGRKALAKIGLEECMVANHGVPMAARMIHSTDGTKRIIPYDPHSNQCIYSVGRNYLNGILLSAAEKRPNVHLNFEHKLVRADFDRGKLTFKCADKEALKDVHADLIVGADGAFSAVRNCMLKLPMFNYNQTYIEHSYMELSIPPGANNDMEKNFLHIWPRGGFMMIALPNADRSWTVTLFMNRDQFARLGRSSPEVLVKFFQTNFPDALRLIGRDRLIADFFSNQCSPLVSVKCNPYNVGSRAVIIGDAAHAMVPFYGQGMNAGFEDCYLLDDVLHNYGYSIGKALEQFSKMRNPDAEAICELAMYNYIEMRDLVNRRSFLWRKRLDDLLFRLMPKVWIPLYTSVTFSDMRYSKCIENRSWQDSVRTNNLSICCTI